MALPSSAKEKAVKMQVIAASTKESTTAGPASATESDRPTKMPVPTTAPTPKHTSWKSPMVRLRPCPSRSAPDSAISWWGFLMRGPDGCEGLGGRSGLTGMVSSLVEHVGGVGQGAVGAPVTHRKWGSSVRARTPPGSDILVAFAHVHPIGRMAMQLVSR